MTSNVEIGKWLRKIRLAKQLTQTQMAAAAGRSKQLVSAWEAGRAEITVDSVGRLSRSLGIDPRWLLLGERAGSKAPAGSGPVGPRIPLLTGDEVVSFDGSPISSSGQAVSCFHEFHKACFAMCCPDDSLAPHLRGLDLLIIDPVLRPRPNDLVVVVVLTEKGVRLLRPVVVARRLHYQSVNGTEGPIALTALAPGWPTLVLKLGTDARLVGTIVGYQSKIHNREESIRTEAAQGATTAEG